VDPPRDGPRRPGHQSQLNSYRGQRARRCARGFGNPTFARRCARPLAQFPQFAVLAVEWTVAYAPPIGAECRVLHGAAAVRWALAPATAQSREL
jgi:hypothetical protein